VYIRLWEFVVRSDAVDAFVALYGPHGGWVELFSRSEGYLGTELLRAERDPNRFVTVDRWTGASAYDGVDTGSDAWRALDVEGEALTERETFLGAFETMPGEPSSDAR
jgi:heme-degrading monooxygenase HmoA